MTPCNAPFNNMYFTVRGKVSPCWKTTGDCDQWSQDRSIRDIWLGDAFEKYRHALEKNIFLNRCKECEKNINEGVWPLAKAYEDFPIKQYPSLMELELSNQCNLECIMCSGELSSGIRKNRDKLPPLPMIYDESFREQLHEFIPHLTELRFNGGEPFAQKIVLDICDDVARINPGLKINMATNGTVINKRVRHIMSNNNLHFNISIDSLIPYKYEEIRINGKFYKLMINTVKFAEYCKENNRDLSIMVNPMRNNWEEMVHFVEFTHGLNANLWFNTILYPKQYAIWNLPTSELTEIYNTMKDQLTNLDKSLKTYSVFEHLVEKQIKNWLLDSYII
jgi:radical SAM protein with 4Fe4S-binding SPASM domain